LIQWKTQTLFTHQKSGPSLPDPSPSSLAVSSLGMNPGKSRQYDDIVIQLGQRQFGVTDEVFVIPNLIVRKRHLSVDKRCQSA